MRRACALLWICELDDPSGAAAPTTEIAMAAQRMRDISLIVGCSIAVVKRMPAE